jgi:hypothetical protein
MNWQYKTIVLPSSEQRENMLTEMGLNGWELVGFEQGLAYFKRPSPADNTNVTINGSASAQAALLDTIHKALEKSAFAQPIDVRDVAIPQTGARFKKK